ncbi:MAG: hypothetical protein K2G23_04025, partial [Muribaculaceae bacterium]|nr:hypothetical protein [Muribaculaceae bacterium]
MKKLFFLMLIMTALFPVVGYAQEIEPVSKEKDSVDGKYIYIPDSLQNDVFLLLKGGKKVVDDDEAIGEGEMTLWKGDTVPMVLKTRNFARERFNRGLFNHLFIPKGNWTFGLTASYGEFSSDDLDVLGLLTDIDLNIHAFSIRPSFAYFIKNNLSVGLRFGYNSMKGSIGSFKVDIDEDMNFSLEDVMYRNEGYSAAMTLSQYIGLTRRGRFGVFNEVELAFSSGNSDFRRPFGDKLRETHTTYMDASLNFSPGVCVFIMD